MKKLIDSRYFWLLTALLGAVLLPLLTLVSVQILLALPAEYGIRDTTPLSDSFLLVMAIVVVFQSLTGFILGACAGSALRIWREKKAIGIARLISLCGSSCVPIFFGYLATIIRLHHREIWVVVPAFGYPLLFALVLFLWGLHLPNRKPNLQTESETDSSK